MQFRTTNKAQSPNPYEGRQVRGDNGSYLTFDPALPLFSFRVEQAFLFKENHGQEHTSRVRNVFLIEARLVVLPYPCRFAISGSHRDCERDERCQSTTFAR